MILSIGISNHILFVSCWSYFWLLRATGVLPIVTSPMLFLQHCDGMHRKQCSHSIGLEMQITREYKWIAHIQYKLFTATPHKIIGLHRSMRDKCYEYMEGTHAELTSALQINWYTRLSVFVYITLSNRTVAAAKQIEQCNCSHCSIKYDGFVT